MEVRDLINKVTLHLGQFYEKGEEIQPVYCPYCNGGPRKDKKTFSMNKETGAYICFRGSCGVQGNIYELADFLGVDYKVEKTTPFRTARPQKVYKKPEVKDSDLTESIIEYFQKRGISKETLEVNRVTESKGNIVFNYFDENGEKVFVKYKIPRKPRSNKEMKSWREAGGKPILYGIDRATDYSKPLVIVEGEPDKLVLDEAGVKNAVSIPSGVKDFEWVSLNWEWLENFKEIILWGDNDPGGKQFIQEAVSKLDTWKLKIVKSQYKDANVVLFKEGKEAVVEAVKNAKTVSKDYILDVADVKRKDYRNRQAIPTGFKSLDKALGGFSPGELVVWTGYTGGGKSTFISNILSTTIENHKSFIYSGELPSEDLKETMDLQILGRDHIKSISCPVKGEPIPTADPELFEDLDNYYREKAFLFDSGDYATDKDVLKAMEYMSKRENCKIFVIDNLMVVPLTDSGDQLEKTGKFISRLKAFARNQNVTVHLVAHPRKPAGDQNRMDVYSVAGTSNIVNLADRVIVIHRINDKDREQEPVLENFDTILTIEKDRKYGIFKHDINFRFDRTTKRFFTDPEEETREVLPKFKYKKQKPLEYDLVATESPDLPF